jgi:hypothetical protein
VRQKAIKIVTLVRPKERAGPKMNNADARFIGSIARSAYGCGNVGQGRLIEALQSIMPVVVSLNHMRAWSRRAATLGMIRHGISITGVLREIRPMPWRADKPRVSLPGAMIR